MHVADILKRKGTQVISVGAADLVSTAVEKLNAYSIGALVILDETGRAVGIVSERDIVRGLSEEGPEILSQTVDNLMSRRLHVCSPQDEVRDLMARMTHSRIRHLPVVDNERLLGLISIGDVVKYRLDEVQTESMVLRDIVISR
jgi:CBS domain-containing protein